MPKIGQKVKEDQWARAARLAKKTHLAWMGVDPGIKGGISIISGKVVDHYVMPDSLMDLADLIEYLYNIMGSNGISLRVVMERVHSMPKQSAQSGFTFGRGYGRLEALLVRFSVEDVPPQTWMKALNIPSGKGGRKSAQKKKLRAKAQQLFPSLPLWKKPRSMGEQLAVCDSLLIAQYCRLRYPNG